MDIVNATLNGTPVVAVAGRIDSTTADALDAHLQTVCAAGPAAVIVDFAAVEYISSAGLRVMLALAKRLKDRRARLALCALGGGVRQVFALAGFLPLFQVEESRERAAQALGTG